MAQRRVSSVRLRLVAVVALLVAVLPTAAGPHAQAIDGPVEVVYVASARNYPDALTGSVLASLSATPLLLVEPSGELPAPTVTALQALRPNRIVIFGGPAAVASDVFEALKPYARSGDVSRLFGDDRNATAAAIANALPARVRDSDLLDGMDSSAFLTDSDASEFLTDADAASFLPAGGTAVNADAVGGFPHEALRSLPLPIQGPYNLNPNPSITTEGLSFDSTGYGSVTWAGMLPADRAPGTPVRVEVVVMPRTTDCDLALYVQGRFYLPGTDDSPTGVSYGEWLEPGAASGDVIVHVDSRVEVLTFVAPPEDADVGPNAGFSLNVTRDASHTGETCDSFVDMPGITIRY